MNKDKVIIEECFSKEDLIELIQKITIFNDKPPEFFFTKNAYIYYFGIDSYNNNQVKQWMGYNINILPDDRGGLI